MKNIDTLTDPVVPTQLELPLPAPSPIDLTLADRQKTHGDFANHAWTTQGIKAVMHGSIRWDELTNTQREALEMVAHKIGRILSGDPEFHDHWHDCIGYLRLVERGLSC